jgi:MoxR-like ATPase
MPVYTGETLKTAYVRDGVKEIDPYFPAEELKEAVNLALFLRRPLLIMGEPGCGKTRLAEAVAFDLYDADYEKHFFIWYVKSTTKARDGIYTFDAVARLRMTQLETREELEHEKSLKAKDLETFYTQKGYLQKGPLARAFDASTADKPAILLIDEIDKADIDFPNDLLLELDRNTYYIAETDTYTSRSREAAPIVFITSNNEKELPPAFLRRCLYHFIPFPSPTDLKTILNGHFPENDPALAQVTLDAFLLVRDRLIQGLSEKKLSTSELIDWFKVIQDRGKRGEWWKGQPLDEALRQALTTLGDRQARTALPFHQVLLKNWESLVNLLPDASKG